MGPVPGSPEDPDCLAVQSTLHSSGNTLRNFSLRIPIPWRQTMDLEGVDVGVQALACYYPFDSGLPFSIEDPEGNSEDSSPGIHTREEDAVGCHS